MLHVAGMDFHDMVAMLLDHDRWPTNTPFDRKPYSQKGKVNSNVVVVNSSLLNVIIVGSLVTPRTDASMR